MSVPTILSELCKIIPSLGADIAKLGDPSGAVALITVLKHVFDALVAADPSGKKKLVEQIAREARVAARGALDETGLVREALAGHANLQIGVGNLETQVAECIERLGKLSEQLDLRADDLHGAILAALPPLPAQTLSEIRVELNSIPILQEALRQTRIADAVEFETKYLEQVRDVLGQLDVLGLQTRDSNIYPLDLGWISVTVSGGRWAGAASNAAEDFLWSNRQAAIRGSAGSGKTTLLQWLACRCATPPTAQRPNSWFGHVPFLIRLRNCNGGNTVLPGRGEWVRATLPKWSGAAPPGWVDEALNLGRAVVLIDGVDELAAERREALWAEVQEIARTGTRIYVTSRALSDDTRFPNQWQPGPMSTAELFPLSDAQVRELISKWHAALASELRLRRAAQAEIDRLSALEKPLLERLFQPEHKAMRALADTPLLCAAICVVNRQSEGTVVASQCDLFERCCEALVYVRDSKRGIQVSDELNRVSPQHWMEIHSRIALDMLINPPGGSDAGSDPLRMEARRDEVLAWLTEAANVQTYTHVRAFIDAQNQRKRDDQRELSGPHALLKDILERRALLREAADGRFDFHHRTLRDYLAARAVPLKKYEKSMLAHVGDDRWREVIRLYPGTKLAGARDGDWIIRELLAVAEASDAPKAWRLRAAMLAMGCHGTRQGTTDDADVERIWAALGETVGQLEFSVDDAEWIATLGDRALDCLKLTQANLRAEGRAAACAKLLRLIGTRAAQDKAVQALGASTHQSVRLELENWSELNPLRLEWIRAEVQEFRIEARPAVARIMDLTPLIGLTQLRWLALNRTGVTDLAPLKSLTQLHALFLSQTGVTDLTPLNGLTQLQVLDLNQTSVTDLTPLNGLTQLEVLYLNQTGVTDLTPLNGLTQLVALSLIQTGVTDLTPLKGLTQLQLLYLNQTGVTDLTPIKSLTQVNVYVTKGGTYNVPAELKGRVYER